MSDMNVGRGLVLGDIHKDCKPLIVGLDFGTAYSGIAIAYKADPGSIHCYAPGTSHSSQTKTPTALLKLDSGEWEFGYAAEEKYTQMLLEKEPDEPVRGKLFKRFKMLLKDQNTGYDTLTAPSVCGVFHPLMELVVISLTKLKEFALAKAALGYGGQVDATRDVQWVLTVPAIWNDFGKAFMRKAAFRAGLTKQEHSTENLILVLEPESASLAVHVSSSGYRILIEGTRFMVLDCGGGTVDITVHEVRSVSPLHIKAVIVPTGGDWGGDYVNMEFRKFLKELLGPVHFKEATLPYEFYSIMAEFDRVKIAFDPQRAPSNIRLIDVLDTPSQLYALAEAYNANHPTTPIIISNLAKKGSLAMSKELMLSFFEPFLAKTVAMVQGILKQHQNIQNIMVVGGFGSSNVLSARISSEFSSSAGGESRGVSVVVPAQPQGAIAHGAVYFGLHKEIITSRLAQFTYGVAMQRQGVSDCFYVLVRKGQEIHQDHEVSLEGCPRSPAQDSLTWRIFQSDEEEPHTVIGQRKLGSFTAHCPPHEDQSKRRQRGVFKFGGPELQVTIVNYEGVSSAGFITIGG